MILRGEPEKLGQALTEVYAKVTSRGSEDQGGKGALTLASPPAWCAWVQFFHKKKVLGSGMLEK